MIVLDTGGLYAALDANEALHARAAAALADARPPLVLSPFVLAERWDPLRDHPRFQALLVKYASPDGN
jgi:predicted nucleic acid-binding protein